jgi:hypothetical protein
VIQRFSWVRLSFIGFVLCRAADGRQFSQFRRPSVFPMLVFAAASSQLWAQSDHGTIAGAVPEPAIVPAAKITARGFSQYIQKAIEVPVARITGVEERKLL